MAAAASIVTLLSAALTGAAALGGVYLSTVLKRRDDDILRRTEKEARRAEITRERGERLYVDLDHLRFIVSRWTDSQVKYLRGTINAKALGAALARNSFDPKPIQESKMTVGVYFPQLSEEFGRIRKAVWDITARSNELLDKKTGGGRVGEAEIDQFEAMVTDACLKLDRLCSRVATILAEM